MPETEDNTMIPVQIGKPKLQLHDIISSHRRHICRESAKSIHTFSEVPALQFLSGEMLLDRFPPLYLIVWQPLMYASLNSSLSVSQGEI